MANKKFLTDNDIEYTIEELEDIMEHLRVMLDTLYNDEYYDSRPLELSKLLNKLGKELIKLSVNLY